jgi:UPF0271 protein
MNDPAPGLDLNCDLAEGEPCERTAALMAFVTSANIACGGHAGGVASMRHAIRLALRLGVNLGAHPGLPGNFGREPVAGLSPADFLTLLQSQVHPFQDLVQAEGGRLHHIKLHGALYHATEQSPVLREAYLAFITRSCPTAIVFAQAAGPTVAAARTAGLTAWDEGFADRGYLPDGSLVPRGQPDALVSDPEAVARRVTSFALGQPITSVDGSPLSLPVHTLCLHGDSPESLSLLQAARQALAAAGGPPPSQPAPRARL